MSDNETTTDSTSTEQKPLTRRQKIAKVMMNPYTISLATAGVTIATTYAQLKMKQAGHSHPQTIVFPDGYDPFNLNPIE